MDILNNWIDGDRLRGEIYAIIQNNEEIQIK